MSTVKEQRFANDIILYTSSRGVMITRKGKTIDVFSYTSEPYTNDDNKRLIDRISTISKKRFGVNKALKNLRFSV